MNDENLRPFNTLTETEQRELARKGGIASGKARREKADMRRLLAAMLEEEVEGKAGEKLTYAQLMTKSIMTIASSPKQGGAAVRAYQTILHTMGMDEPEPNLNAYDTDGFIEALKNQAEETMTEAGDIVEE